MEYQLEPKESRSYRIYAILRKSADAACRNPDHERYKQMCKLGDQDACAWWASTPSTTSSNLTLTLLNASNQAAFSFNKDMAIAYPNLSTDLAGQLLELSTTAISLSANTRYTLKVEMKNVCGYYQIDNFEIR